MPSKSEHVTYTRLTKNHMNNYLKGKSITIKPSDHNDESNTVVKIHYKTKKSLTKLNRNLAKNKGTRVNPDEIHDLQLHDGKGLFDSIKKVMSNPAVSGIVKAITPIAANLVSQQVKNLTGSDAAADISKTLINAGSNSLQSQSQPSQPSGNGFNLHSIGLGMGPTRGKLGGSFAPLLGGSLSANQFTGIGTNNPSFSNPNDRMAHVRSFRKIKNGVAM